MLFSIAQAYTLNSEPVESVLITNKFGEIPNHFIPLWSNNLGIKIFTYSKGFYKYIY